jgi:hypothetical protein
VITLNGPVTLTLKPDTVARILDLLATQLPYNVAKPIIEDELFPQLQHKPEEKSGGSDGG